MPSHNGTFFKIKCTQCIPIYMLSNVHDLVRPTRMCMLSNRVWLVTRIFLHDLRPLCRCVVRNTPCHTSYNAKKKRAIAHKPFNNSNGQECTNGGVPYER